MAIERKTEVTIKR